MNVKILLRLDECYNFLKDYVARVRPLDSQSSPCDSRDTTSQKSLLGLLYEEEHKQGGDAFGIADFARGNKPGYIIRGNVD